MRHSLLLGGLLGLLVGCGEIGGGSSISGMVTAPAGADVAGTAVFACYDDDPECARLGETVITGAGNAASYSLGALAPGSYSVYALSDTNEDGIPNSGDFYGYYGRSGGQAILVSPPRANVNIEMITLTEEMQVQDLPGALRQAIAKRR
jgi:hypothetical protein